MIIVLRYTQDPLAEGFGGRASFEGRPDLVRKAVRRFLTVFSDYTITVLRGDIHA